MRVLLWRAIPFPSCERAIFRATDGGYRLEGTIVGAIESRPLESNYVVECDSGFRTRSVEVNVRNKNGLKALFWSVDELGFWWQGGQEITALRGCVDVDLGASPSTNTLPIRRLNLRVGISSDLTVAWIRFPELAIEPQRQRYTRVRETGYRVEHDGAVYDLEVDSEGLVTQYADIWERVATEDVG